MSPGPHRTGKTGKIVEILCMQKGREFEILHEFGEGKSDNKCRCMVNFYFNECSLVVNVKSSPVKNLSSQLTQWRCELTPNHNRLTWMAHREVNRSQWTHCYHCMLNSSCEHPMRSGWPHLFVSHHELTTTKLQWSYGQLILLSSQAGRLSSLPLPHKIWHRSFWCM